MINLGILILSGLFGAASVFGAAFSANPASDAFVTSGPNGNLANNNYGGAGSLAVSAPGLPQGEIQSVLQFNLGSALTAFNTQFGAGQWNVQSVTLQLTAAPANNTVFNTPAAGLFGVSWMQNDSWQEGSGTPAAPGVTGITFSSLQGAFSGTGDQAAGTFSFNGATSGSASYTLSLTPGLLNDITSGDNVSLRIFSADGGVSGVFNSRSFATSASRPLLTVVAIPEPAPMALGGLARLSQLDPSFKKFCGIIL